MKQRVIILGAGIGGLTVAHELVRSSRDYEIHIYEKNDTIGGMARSGSKLRNGINLPTEYCWRIYGPNYDNLRDILQQIPLVNSHGKYVHDNLVDIKDYLVADQNSIIYMNNSVKTLIEIRRAFKKVPLRQKYTVLSKIIYCFLVSTKRLNKMDKLSWSEYIDPNGTLCHDIKKYVIDIMGPYLGADLGKVNVPSVAKTLESFRVGNGPISVMNGPTSRAWFDHWHAYLEDQGVQIHLNSKIKDINTHNDTVDGVFLEDGTEIKGNIFYCGLPVESIGNINSLKTAGMSELAKKGHQLMVSIQLYFNKKVHFSTNNQTAMYIPDSPWQLVIEPQGAIWGKSYGDIADLWSIGLCDYVRPGILIKKPFIECSHDEIREEVWYQICKSELGEHLSLDEIEVLDYNVWNSYVYNGKYLETIEPKFSTNKGTHRLRPENRTKFKNLFFATGYTKTETDMFEMESAAEAGKRAAFILEKSVKIFPCPRPIAFAPYRALDTIFAKFNMFKHFPLGWYVFGLPFSLIFSLSIPFSRLKFRTDAVKRRRLERGTKKISKLNLIKRGNLTCSNDIGS